MTWNTFGRVLRVTTWGESHGPAIGAIVDGCPPGLELDEPFIQQFLDARKPGGPLASQRREPDLVSIQSGVYNGRTTGTPISLVIANVDARSKDYDDLVGRYRPGHGDFTYEAKYGAGHRDPRGGGRASARETACRVAAGAVARRVLGGVEIAARIIAVGGSRDREAFETIIEAARKAGTSVGGLVEVRARGVPAGWGGPCYARMDAEIAAALMGINACKGVEIGEGVFASCLYGHEMRHEGGIMAGITDGNDIIARAAFKPTPSIVRPQLSVDRAGEQALISTKGRHDPCVAWRAPPICEAMVALVLADHKLLHRAQCGDAPCSTSFGSS